MPIMIGAADFSSPVQEERGLPERRRAVYCNHTFAERYFSRSVNALSTAPAFVR